MPPELVVYKTPAMGPSEAAICYRCVKAERGRCRGDTPVYQSGEDGSTPSPRSTEEDGA